MLERDGYPAGVPCWVDTAQPDVTAAVDFYAGLFGWEFEDRMPPDGPGHYFVAKLRGRDVAAVGSQPEGSPPEPVWNTYVWVDNAEDTAAKVREAGGSVLMEPFDVLDAGRMAVCADPAGALFSLWQAGTHRGAQIVNEPGSWNWSDLNTRDIDGAKAFYRMVFGWETDTIDLGLGQSEMIRVPGYADHLEALDPDVRRRHADAGAPPGFTESIGWMQPIDADQFFADVTPHWSVTFSIDDPDAAAARAESLGGQVVVAPHDAGPVRLATLSDPQGAVFTVSLYQPD